MNLYREVTNVLQSIWSLSIVCVLRVFMEKNLDSSIINWLGDFANDKLFVFVQLNFDKVKILLLSNETFTIVWTRELVP